MPLTLLFLVFMAVSMAVTNVVARKNLKCAADRQETIAVLTGVVEEYYNGRDVIKAYNHEEESIQRVSQAAEANRAANQRADFLTNCVNPLIRLLTRLAQVVIAVVAGKAMLDGAMSVGVVQAFFQYVNQTAEPLTEASYMINSLQAALASAERTFQLLDEEEERPDPEYPAVVERARGTIAFEHVSFGYTPDRLLMRDISFTAQPGQKIAVVGSTGAGKTDHPHQPAHALLRGERRPDHRGWGAHRRHDPLRPAEELRHGPPGHLAVRRDGGGEHRLRPPRRYPGGDRGRGQGRQGGLLHPHHAPRL